MATKNGDENSRYLNAQLGIPSTFFCKSLGIAFMEEAFRYLYIGKSLECTALAY